MRFKPGEQVVCIKRGVWVGSHSGLPFEDGRTHPKYNDIVTVDGYKSPAYLYIKGYNFISPNGIRQGLAERRFAPIQSNLDEIKEVLKQPMEI